MKDPKVIKSDSFVAVIKRGPYSKTLGGQEGAGQRLGPFVATEVTPTQVETDDRKFLYTNFEIVKQAAQSKL